MIIDRKKVEQAVLKAYQKNTPKMTPVLVRNGGDVMLSITPYALATVGIATGPFRESIFKDLTTAYEKVLGAPRAENEAGMTGEMAERKDGIYRKVVRLADGRAAWMNTEVLKFTSKNSKVKWYLAPPASPGGRGLIVVQATDAMINDYPWIEMMVLGVEAKEGEK